MSTKAKKIINFLFALSFLSCLLWLYLNLVSFGQPPPPLPKVEAAPTPSWENLCEHSHLAFNMESPLSEPREGLLDRFLFDIWYQKSQRGVLKYEVENLSFKRVNGSLGYLATYNPGRSYFKRRTPVFSFNDSISLPFNPDVFNFQKLIQLSSKELLFSLTERDSTNAIYCSDTIEHAVFINVNPITLGHFLIVPQIDDQLPQLLTKPGLHVGLTFATQSSNPNFFVIFNSQGAFASVNHLHLQTFYAPYSLPLVRAATKSHKKLKLPSKATLDISSTVDYPLSGVLIEIQPIPGKTIDAADRDAIVSCAWNGIHYLSTHNVPHSILMTDSGKKIFLIPRLPQTFWNHTDTSTPGSFETAGIWVVFSQEVYDSVSEESLSALLAEFAVSKDFLLEFLKYVVDSCTNAS